MGKTNADIERSVEARTDEVKAVALAHIHGGHSSIWTVGPYRTELTLDCAGAAWLYGDLPELVDMGDAGHWGKRLDAAAGCLARAVACAEHGYRPALDFE